MPPPLVLVQRPSELRCPLCHAALGEAPKTCADCGTAAHASCVTEFGGCGTLGCQGGKRVVRLGGQPTDREAGEESSWGEGLGSTLALFGYVLFQIDIRILLILAVAVGVALGVRALYRWHCT